jgi:two-component system cell cycle response regulator
MEVKNVTRLKRRYYLYSLLLLILAIVVRLFIDTQHIKKMLKDETESYSFHLQAYYLETLEALEDKYYTISNLIASDPKVKELLDNKDRTALYEYTEKYYVKLKRDNPHLQVMQFFNPDNSPVLRMQNVDAFGGNATDKRPVIDYVNKNGIGVYGFEVGSCGANYRITTPLAIDENSSLGVFEFGIHPSFFVKKLKDRFEADLMVLVKTDALQSHGLYDDYPKIKEYSVISRDSKYDLFFSKIDLNEDYQIFEHDERTFVTYNDFLLDTFNGDAIARIMVLKDITVYTKQSNHLIWISSLSNMFALFVIGILIYIMLSRYTTSLQTLQHSNIQINREAQAYKDKANTDHLTQLYNREYLSNFWNSHLFSDEKDNVMMLFDIDYFKKINDTYGHDIGDEVLQQIAKISQNFFRENDVIVRYGGEEFLIILEKIEYAHALRKTEAFRAFIQSDKRFPEEIEVTISIGISKFEIGETMNRVIKRADNALYEAKKLGRNRVVESMQEL